MKFITFFTLMKMNERTEIEKIARGIAIDAKEILSIYQERWFFIYCCIMSVILGAAVGSFLNCVAWRIVHGESFLIGRSHCPACGHMLGVFDLFPILSWLFLRGKCRYCGSKISMRYELTECFFALITLFCLLRFDLTLLCLRNYIFLCCLFCLSLVDLESFMIPNGCLMIPALAWFLSSFFLNISVLEIGKHFLAAIIVGGGTLCLSLLMDRILKKESLGGGDIKLFALMGLYLGFIGSLFALLLSCIVGLLFAVRIGRGKPFPFAPAISCAVSIMLLWGEPLIMWYMNLLT